MLAAALTAALASADEPKSIALLTSNFQNDHEEYEPTKDAERARMSNIIQIFKTKLEQSGKYKVVEPSPDVQLRIDKDQKMGECGGCEVRYGSDLDTREVA